MQPADGSSVVQTSPRVPHPARRVLGCSVLAAASTAWMTTANPARAQASDTKSAVLAPAIAATQAANTGSGADAAGTPDAAEQAKFKYLDSLGEKGWIVPRPSTAESVIADTGGIRSALAQYGIGFLGLGSYSFFGDTLRQTGGVQVYNGQQPTFASSTAFSASLNLDRYGVPNAQITAAGARLTSTWRPFGPPAFSLQRLNYYQTFLDRKIELKVGYTTNHYEFFGTSVGGNIISGTLGPNANIVYQAGMARTPLTAPAINLRWNVTDNLYVKSGIQRSISPKGSEAEHQANPSGFQFLTPKARALFINEVGYKRVASAEERSLWVRGGFLYNDSPYAVFGTTRTSSNRAFAFLADTQLVKTNPAFPERGVYGGVSFLKGDPDVDGTDQYYEGRLYGVGVIPQRPKDFVSLVYTHNRFSGRVYALTQARGVPAVDRINNLTVSYSIHLARGVFLNNGLTYGDHATTSPITRPVLVFASALAVVF